MPTMLKVVSSQISDVGYDLTTRELFVTFKNGSTYKYSNIPLDEYNSLLKAESIGKYFSENIKGNYNSVKL